MIVTLIVTKGPDEGRIFRLVDGENKVIGRSSRADIILHDDGVSRRHCRARIADNVFRIADLNSKNGTACKGKPISGDVQLNDQDLLDIGHTSLTVRILSEDKAQHQTAPVPPKDSTVNESDAAVDDEPESSVMGAFEHYLEQPSGAAPPPPPEAEAALCIAATPAPEPKAVPEVNALIGKVIAGYRVDAFFGEDDISHVYGATQLSMERTVSLKILSPELTHDGAAIDRFIKAARAAGKLSHPNIVQVYDAGEEGGRYFIALELVEGQALRLSLQERGHNRPLPINEALDIADQIADALAYAHGQSVVHRNLSPDCIYLTPHKVAKLADLGFSKNLADSGIQRPSRFGERPSELYFISPEQLADPRAAGLQADIYALGTVLFVMLTGHMPFRGESAQDLFERVRDGRRESLQRLQRDVPPELVGVVDRAMAHERGDRYQSASAFLKDLRKQRIHLKL